jgi:uncharacterized membrane protein
MITALASQDRALIERTIAEFNQHADAHAVTLQTSTPGTYGFCATAFEYWKYCTVANVLAESLRRHDNGTENALTHMRNYVRSATTDYQPVAAEIDSILKVTDL